MAKRRTADDAAVPVESAVRRWTGRADWAPTPSAAIADSSATRRVRIVR
jgi:hypothetical protein